MSLVAKLLTFLFLLSPPAFSFADDLQATPSKVNENPKIYVGKDIVMTGFFLLDRKTTQNGNVIIESKKIYNSETRDYRSGKNADPAGNVKYCLDIMNPEILYKYFSKYDHKTLKLHGTVVDNYEVYGGCGGNLVFKIAAERIPR